MRHSKMLVLALLALAAAVALTACGGDDDGKSDAGRGAVDRTQTTDPFDTHNGPAAVLRIVIKGGEPVGGVAELEYDAGDQVHFEVESDVADEVHVHGYDIAVDVRAGIPTFIDFPAEIEGIFEIELEELGEQIAELRVNP